MANKELMDKVEEVYKNAGALLQPSGNTDITGTRWHYGDLYGRILTEFRGDDRLHLFLCKGHEGERYFFQDIGTESLTKERCDQRRKEWGSYKFSCLIQNDHSC